MTPARLSEADRLQEEYERAARRLAARLATGDLDTVTRAKAMNTVTRSHVVEQWRLGAGGRIRSGADLDRILSEQTAYSAGYAAEVERRRRAGEPFSEAYPANRASLYAGAGREAYFRGSELVRGRGQRYRYEARDDGGTCSPCRAAEGEYAAGEGPMPGQTCSGRSRCRCRRVPVA